MIRLRHLIHDVSRHGRRRVYFCRGKGHAKIRLMEPEGSAAFHARYAELLRQSELEPQMPPVRGSGVAAWHGTLGALALRYQASAAFAAYDAATIKKRRHLLGVMMDEPVVPGEPETFRAFPVERLSPERLAILRDRPLNAGKIGQANERVKALRALFRWAVDPSVRAANFNPAETLSGIRRRSEGWHTWTIAEIDQFEARHPPGTRAHLALQILLYTGARRSDIIRLGRPHVQTGPQSGMGGGSLRWTAHKGRKTRPTVIEIDILPPLAQAIDVARSAGILGDVTWLVNELGRPFTHAGFGGWWRDRCIEAGLPHCSAHGLRKAGATRAAENGATAHMLMSMFGWHTLAQAELYTRAAERKRLARAGMATLLRVRASKP